MKRKNFLKLVSLLSIASVAAISVASCKRPATEQKMPQKSDDSNNKKTESDDNKNKEEKTTPPTESKPVDTGKKTDNQPSKESVDKSDNKADSANSGADSSAMNGQGMANSSNQDGNSNSTGTTITSNVEGATHSGENAKDEAAKAGGDATVDHQSNEVKNPDSADGSKSEDSEKTKSDKEEMPPVDPSFASGGLTTSWGDTGLPGIDNKESTDKLENNPSEAETKDNDLMQPSVSDSGVGMTHSWAEDGISQPIGGETSPTEPEHFTTGWAENGAYNSTDPSQPDQAYPPAPVGYPYGTDETTTKETSPQPMPSETVEKNTTGSWGDSSSLPETSPELSK
ncbi:hypothetical protein [Mycoplasma bradburyae]|uniref:hypothetical protein n=1 Tax=Mycoplasma bradburyae TaxID=2963128 RepID=UPI00234036DF|nr:hypothetical protein [Mycoplasma bradburyae]MDC4182700.1 hypothetical protein [Mycoplasma bradburyae]